MALAAETLDELIKPELRQEWVQTKTLWFPRTDTAENAAYDKRTPGELNSYTRRIRYFFIIYALHHVYFSTFEFQLIIFHFQGCSR